MNKHINQLWNIIQKAGNNWGNKIPIKKETSDGRMITYWVSPEDLNQGKMKGQQNLFGDEEMNQGPEPEDSYYSKLDKDTENVKVKPLISKIAAVDPLLAKRIVKKYENYSFGRETRDLDIDIDFELAYSIQMMKNHPDMADLYKEEFIAVTQKKIKMLNNRKMAMARLKKGSEVVYQGKPTKIVSINDRGFPIIEVDGEKRKVFVDEIFDVDKLANSYNKDGTLKKSLTFSGYKLQDRTKIYGMDISIENKKGSYRSGVDSDGHEWKVKMNYDYGYIRGTVGTDGDHVDCYIGPEKNAEEIFIIHQNNPITHDYDEDKCMIGFKNKNDAIKAYKSQYDRPGFFGSCESVSIEDFKTLIYENKGKKLHINKSIYKSICNILGV